MTRREPAQRLEKRFVTLCERILSTNGYKIKANTIAKNDVDADIIVKSPNGQLIAVETKLYRSPIVSSSLIENAVQQLLRIKEMFHADGALLITTLPGLPSLAIRPSLAEEIELWDIQNLSEMVKRSRELEAELATFLRDAEIGSVGTEPPPEQIADILAAVPSQQMMGAGLISELSSIRPGRRHWRNFEDWCTRTIKYLFSDQFGQITTQRVVEGGYLRNDLIVRIVPTHLFWKSLASDFRTRYVVFEFKNYRSAISQDQVFTTEKYLYLAALRSVAIIVCRSGFKRSAMRAAKGALRESGKLLLFLDINDTKRMLEAKDKGDDPTNLLIEILDETLIDMAP